MKFASTTVALPIVFLRHLKRSPETADRMKPYSYVRPLFLRDSGLCSWSGILVMTMLNSLEHWSQPIAPHNDVVHDNRKAPDPMEGFTAFNSCLCWPSYPWNPALNIPLLISYPDNTRDPDVVSHITGTSFSPRILLTQHNFEVSFAPTQQTS